MTNEQREKQRRRNYEAALRWLVNDRKGRQIVWEILAKTGFRQPTFSTDALLMARAEGRRSVGNELLGEILNVEPDAYAAILVEHAASERQQEKDRERSDGDDYGIDDARG